MSSISSFSGRNTVASFNVIAQNKSAMNDLKSFLCSNCGNSFDIYLRQNVFVGRVPLILHCNHNQCQECVRASMVKKQITCSECREVSIIEENDKRKTQEIFPVNFYIMGLLYYAKPNMNEISVLNLKPSGMTHRTQVKGTSSTLASPNRDTGSGDITIKSILQEKCSQTTCDKIADVRCFDCDELYCHTCCQIIHKVARGLQFHKISLLSEAMVPEVKEKCPIHKDSPLEFNCNTCNEMLCCYCVLQGHRDHDYNQLTSLDKVKQENFDELIQKADEKLKKLIFTYKNVQQEILRNNTAVQTTPIDVEIGKYFGNLHAKLQMFEKKQRADALKAKTLNSTRLNDINTELSNNIRTLTNLIGSARNVNNPNFTMKLNVKLITEKLENALDLPCYLIGKSKNADGIEFVHEDVLQNLEENCYIKFSENSSDNFHLVDENEVPEGFDTTIPNELNSFNLSSVTSMPQSPSGACSVVDDDGRSFKSSPLDHFVKSKSPAVTSPAASIANWMQNEQEITNEYPIFNAGDREIVLVTHIETPECFYVQIKDMDRRLRELSKEIKQHIRNFAPKVKHPEINNLYIVKYDVKGSPAFWYRGRIIDIMVNDREEQQYNVLFIDYGNTKIVKQSMLREITPSLAKLKPFAYHCKLYDTYPINKNWDPRAMKLMAQMITGTEIAMIIIKNSHGVLEVDLRCISHGEACSIRTALIFIGHAASYVDTSLDDANSKTGMPKMKLHPKMTNFKKGRRLNVIISHFIDPFNIYVQEAEYVHHIKNQSHIMTNLYVNNKNRPDAKKQDYVYVPRKEMPVAVYDEEESMWYRGIIIDVFHGQGLAKVFLPDVGKNITTSYTSLRRLDKQFFQLECQAMLVKLADVKPPNDQQNWTGKQKHYFDKYIQFNCKLSLLIWSTDLPPEVVLFDTSATVDTCINALMVNENIAEATGDMARKTDWKKENVILPKSNVNLPHSNVIFPKPSVSIQEGNDSFLFDMLNTSQTTRKTNKEYDDDEDETVNKLNQNIIKKPVRVLSCESPDLICIAFEDNKAKQQQFELQRDLQNYYSTHHMDGQNWKVSDQCVVLNRKENKYCRAVIVEKTDDINFQVLLLDVAQTITVSKKNIMKLENQFKQTPNGAIRCHLGGIVPAGDVRKWSKIAIELLQDVLKKYRNIFITKNGPIDKNRKSLSVIMWYSEFKAGSALEPSSTILRDINKLLVDKGLAFKDDSPSALSFSSSSGDEKRTESVSSESSVTLQSKIIGKLDETSNHEPIELQDETKNENIPNSTATITEDNPRTDPNEIKETSRDTEDHKSDRTTRKRSRSHDGSNKIKNTENISKSISVGNSPTCSNKLLDEDWNTLIDQENSQKAKCDTDTDTVQPSHDEISNTPPVLVTNLCSSNIDWVPAVPIKKKYFNAYATFVDDNAHIYLHETDMEPVLKRMEKEMKTVFDELPPESANTVWVPEQLCTVKYYVNNSWYRGKILSVTEDAIKVRMVDYGNEEECKPEELRVKIMYAELPIFANEIRLHNVFPIDNHWLTSDMDQLHSLVVDKKLFVQFKDKIRYDHIPAAVVKVGNVNINEYMLKISSHLINRKPKIKKPESLDTDDVIIESGYSDDASITTIAQESQNTSSSRFSKSTFIKQTIPKKLLGQIIDLGVISILNYNKFIFEFVGENIQETRDLFNAISEDVKKNATEQQIIYDLKVGQACVTKFSEDSEWYRAEVLNLDRSDHGLVEVWFVDFGNFELVPRDSIRHVHPDWLQLPVMQLKGEIVDIQLVDDSDLNTAFDYMAQFCGTVKSAEIVSVNPLLVRLVDDDKKLTYQTLIDQNILSLPLNEISE